MGSLAKKSEAANPRPASASWFLEQQVRFSANFLPPSRQLRPPYYWSVHRDARGEANAYHHDLVFATPTNRYATYPGDPPLRLAVSLLNSPQGLQSTRRRRDRDNKSTEKVRETHTLLLETP